MKQWLGFKGKLFYVQYLPTKPVKHGIKVWMRCNSKLAYLHEFDVYLGHLQNSIHGLAYDVVMKHCQHTAGKNHHLYCDNYFTSILLFTYLLNMKIYASGTIRQNKRGLPGEVKKLPRMNPGDHQSFQKENLVTPVWQDNKPIQVLSTNSRPDATDQLRVKYNVGRYSIKTWKYLLWFFVNSWIVNAYILCSKTSTRRTKKRYIHLDFWLEVAHGLIGRYSAWKWKSNGPPNAEAMADANEATHESVYIGATCAKRYKWHLMWKWHRKETWYGCKLCGVYLCKDGCHFAYHNQQQQ